tara:strand:+ start:81 stop:386 length:306 start_codon:yes stop_codon:yes gene_type:complete
MDKFCASYNFLLVNFGVVQPHPGLRLERKVTCPWVKPTAIIVQALQAWITTMYSFPLSFKFDAVLLFKEEPKEAGWASPTITTGENLWKGRIIFFPNPSVD